MNYDFPKTIFADKTNWVAQVEHLLSEADEVAVEFKKWKREPRGSRTPYALFDEVVDLAHSTETLARLLPVCFASAACRVIAKNTERGYYDIEGAMSEPSDEELVVGPIHEETVELPGGSTPSQYGIPDGATDLQDLIEHRDMNFAIGTIMKACYRMGKCSHSDELRDTRKILWFAQREVNRLEGEA